MSRTTTPRTIVIALAIVTMGLACAPASQGQASDTMLLSAIQRGLVTATFSGSGDSSGDVVHVTVRRRAGAGRLRLHIPAGSRLRSANVAVQNMVILEVRGRVVDADSYLPEPEIVVNTDEPVTYVLSAMCADFGKDNPSTADRFTLEAPADSVLACIASRSIESTTTPAAQAAVWIHTDRVTFEGVNEIFSVSETDWNRARQIVDGCAGAGRWP